MNRLLAAVGFGMTLAILALFVGAEVVLIANRAQADILIATALDTAFTAGIFASIYFIVYFVLGFTGLDEA